MNSNENNKNNFSREKINFQQNKPNSGGGFGRRFRYPVSGVIGYKNRREHQEGASFSQEFNIPKIKTLFKLRESLEKYDALISYSTQTRYWLTGFNATEGVSVILLNKRKEIEVHAFLDQRYFEAAKAAITVKNVKLYRAKTELVEFIKSCKLKTLLLESDYTNLSQAVEVRNWVGRECVLFNLVGEELRIVKSTEEIERIKKAVEISLEAYKWVRTSVLLPGVTEEEVARAFAQKMYQLGAEAPAFPPIVAFGQNTANPHHSPGNTKLKAGDIVTLDFGAKYKHYCSDITRTFLAPGVSIQDKTKREELRKVWETVNRSAYIGRETAAAGVTTASVDGSCRKVIEEEGLGEYFAHGTGHGVGLDIHESPRVTPSSSETLEVGNVFTVEPGVYIPRLGGARIEDTLVINNSGIAKILSRPYLYTSHGNYQREFDFFDINQLLRELKVGKATLPVRSQNNRDFFALLRVYEEALRLPPGDEGWPQKNFRERFSDPMINAKKTPFNFRTEEKEGEFGPRPFRSGKPQTFDSVKVQPLSEVLEQVQVEESLSPQSSTKQRRGRRPKQVVEVQSSQEAKPVAEAFEPRRRGRPKKVVEQVTAESGEATPKRRGRPKKVRAESFSSEVSAPKKRGRRPKQVVEVQSSQEASVTLAKETEEERKELFQPKTTQEAQQQFQSVEKPQETPVSSSQRGRKSAGEASFAKASSTLSSPEPAASPRKRGRRPKAVKESGSSSSRRRGK